MATGKPGADSSTLITSRIGGQTLIELSKGVFGKYPVLWGRYFKRFGNTSPTQYQHAREGDALLSKGIRVLPIARQTTRVDGLEAEGINDAKGNVEAVIRTFGSAYLKGQGGVFLIFLDVEGSPHSLSRHYWRGWAETVVSHSQNFSQGDVSLVPCVYAPQGDDTTWQAIADEEDRGTPCGGAWIARWRVRGCSNLLDWNNNIVTPRVKPNCPILLWQYADDCGGGGGIDCNETNPNIADADLLDKLILPPASGAVASPAMASTPPVAAAAVAAAAPDDFSSFIRSLRLRHFTAAELLVGTERVRNGVSNSFPPRELWHNIAPTVIVLDELRQRLGGAVNLNSGYRNPLYNAQLDGAAGRSQHMDFRALDFTTNATTMGDLADRALELRGLRFRIPITGLDFLQKHAPFDIDGLDLAQVGGETLFTWHGGVGEYTNFVHIDCRGENRDW
ncbi:MAG: D-Ala-D-Ala carboxypeptidase family metallohydrolase [Proteobacteria bacterium]|nr:D-Ala-D-Ala carboxypeptidase family metallohydrolase [Pseudomonadota bacterium]